MDRLKADDERFRIGMRVLWVVFDAAFAAVGRVLLTILMR